MQHAVSQLSLLSICVFWLSAPSFCDEPQPKLELPKCDIFLFEFKETKESVVVSNGRNVTQRPEGYDNQPWFTPKSATFLFSSNRKPDRTDVYEYVLSSGEVVQVTDSPDQEYSPQSSPDNKTISFVTDGATANQSVWFASRSGGEPKWLLAQQGEREPVGYYSWNRETGYVLYWSRYGYSIRLSHADRALSHYVSGNAPPTTPHMIPGANKFSFMHRQGNDEVWIKELDPETLAIRPLVKVVGANRNYGWTPKGSILMTEGSDLFRWSPGSDAGWRKEADLSRFGLRETTRVAVSPNGKWLAVVASTPEE